VIVIKDIEFYRRFEDSQLEKDKSSFIKKMRIYEELWKEGKEMGIFPLTDPLEGIEEDIKLAELLNRYP